MALKLSPFDRDARPVPRPASPVAAGGFAAGAFHRLTGAGDAAPGEAARVTQFLAEKFDTAERIETIIRPLLRLLVQVGFVPEEVQINLPQIPSAPLYEKQPIRFDVTRREAIFFDDWDPDEALLGNWIDLPGGVGAAPGLAVTFRYNASPAYAAAILWDWDAGDPNVQSRDFAVVRQDARRGHLTYAPGNAAGFGLDAFVTLLSDDSRAFVTDFLNAFEVAAGGFDQSMGRPIGPTGLLCDPYHWAHAFRWGEDKAERRFRIEQLEAVAHAVWDHYGSTPALARQMLAQEILGVQPGFDPETGTAADPDADPVAFPVEDRLSEALRRTGALFFRAKARNRLGDWLSIIGQPPDAPDTIWYGRASTEPPAPTIAGLRRWSFTDLVADAIDRGLIAYQGASFLEPTWMRQAGFELKSGLLQDIEAVLASVDLAWNANRLQSHAALRALISMIWDIIQVMTNQTQSRFDASHPYPDFFDRIQSDYSFSQDGLAYPEELNDALAKLIVARDQAEWLLQVSIGELRNNAPALTGTPVIRIRSVSEQDRAEVWEDIATALAAADRFFTGAEWSLAPDHLVGRFMAGFLDGVDLDNSDRYYLLLKKIQVSTLGGPVFTGILEAGMICGAGLKVKEVAEQAGSVILDPYGFAEQCARIVRMLMVDPPGDTMFTLGQATGEAVKKSVARLNDQKNVFAFIFELGKILGPLVLEAILSLLFEAYVVAPLLNKAREGLMLMVRTLPGLPVDEIKATARALPGPVLGEDAAGALVDDLAGVPRQTLIDADAADLAAGPSPATAPQRVRDVIDAEPDPDLLEAALEAMPPSQRTRPDAPDATTDPIPADGWDAPDQIAMQARVVAADREMRELFDDLFNAGDLENRQLQLYEPPPVPAAGPVIRQIDLTELRVTLRYLMHQATGLHQDAVGRMVMLLGDGSPYSAAQKTNFLYGLHRLRTGIGNDAVFLKVVNHYGRQSMNVHVIEAIGRPDVDIPATAWQSAHYPGNTIASHVPAVIGTYVRDPRILDEIMAPLHHVARQRIRDAHLANDPASVDLVRPVAGDFVDNFGGWQQVRDLMATVPAHLQARSLEAYRQFGLYAWTFRDFTPPQEFFAIPHPDFPDRPGTFEMWLRANPRRRGQAATAVQQAISGVYYNDPDFAGSFHASHLVPHRWGGPAIPENLVAAGSRANVSYMGEAERVMDWAMDVHGDVYCKTVITGYDADGLPTGAMYYLFTPDADGRPMLIEHVHVTLEPMSETARALDLPDNRFQMLTPDGGD